MPSCAAPRLTVMSRMRNTRVDALTCHGTGGVPRDEVQSLHRDPAAPWEDSRADVRRGARADRERRPARVRRLRGDRALLLPEVLDLDEPDRALGGRRAADEEHPLPHHAARAAVPEPPRASDPYSLPPH